MLRKILVPLDGSPSAEFALPIAARLASRTGAAVELMLVREAPVEPLTMHGTSVDIKRMDEADQQMAEDYLTALTSRVAETAEGVKASVFAVEGEVIGSIRRRVESTDVDAVVMCTHGRGGWSRFWLGSVAQELVRSLHVPILLTRPHGSDAELADPPPLNEPLRVLVTLDGSQYAEQALDLAIGVFGAKESEYRLLRVVVPPVIYEYRVPKAHPDYSIEEEMVKRASAYLEGQAARLRERGIKVSTDVIARQRVAEGIANYAGAEGQHCIAVATHARQGMPRLVLGSVADKVLRSSSIPVLVMRPEAVGQE